MKDENLAKGNQLRLSHAIQIKYYKQIKKLIDRMVKDAKREMKLAFEAGTLDGAMDESIVSQSRIRIKKLLDKWNPTFNRWAKKATEEMIGKLNRNSRATLNMSLKDISETITLSNTISENLREVIKASTLEAANLIKIIPVKYLNEVQGEVMRSITSGRGLNQLIPYMNKKYRQQKRHAKNVALDQTRKAYNNINKARMEKVGIKKFEWIHSGGGQHPRKQHERWNGKIFSFDDLPIDDDFGPVIPGQAINCKCVMKPVLDFSEE